MSLAVRASAANPTPDPRLGMSRGQSLYQVNRSPGRCRREEHGVKFMATARTVWRSLEVGSAVVRVTKVGRLRVLTPLFSGLAAPTSCTVAELEVSGLRGGWAGFQEGRLSLATKTESSPAGRETGEKMIAARTGAAQKALELEMIPERLFLFCLFPREEIRRAQTPIWTWVRVG